jgi:hypothetical protein
MSLPQAEGWTRRRFLGGLTLAGTAGLLGLLPRRVGAEPPPETSTLRIFHTMSEPGAHFYLYGATVPGRGTAARRGVH